MKEIARYIVPRTFLWDIRSLVDFGLSPEEAIAFGAWSLTLSEEDVPSFLQYLSDVFNIRVPSQVQPNLMAFVDSPNVTQEV